jgi:hypothetical protein
MDEEVALIDTPLVADPDADQELGAAEAEAIADEDLRGSRLLLVRRAAEPIDVEGTPGGLVQLVCTFQPADGTRFASAQFRLRFKTPGGIRIIDLAPHVIDDPNPVELTLNRKGQLSLKNLPVEPSVEISGSKKFVRYHCSVQGSGEGTSLGQWTFVENPDRRDGIGREQVLTVTLPVTGAVTGEVIVGARLVRRGVGGAVDAIRDLILGPRPDQRSYPVAFDIPAQPSPSRLERFLRLF